MAAKISFVDLNVRELFETQTVDNVRDVQKKINYEIDRKREELRSLVGESYRDLIDAADTISSMKTGSISITDKLKDLRLNLKSIPTQLGTGTSSLKSLRDKKLTPAELEVAAELKLTLEIPREVQLCLEDSKSIQALHLYLLSANKLSLRTKPYKWTFLQAVDNNADPINSMKFSILSHCETVLQDFTATSGERLAESIVTMQILSQQSCEDVLKLFLSKQLNNSILDNGSEQFIDVVAFTIMSLYSIFIEPQLYNVVAKEVRKPKISMKRLGVSFTPKFVNSFNNETIDVDEAPRVTRLAAIIIQFYITPLKMMLEKSYNDGVYLNNENSLEAMDMYRKSTIDVLRVQCEDMIRIVLGTTKSLWSEVFLNVFYSKCKAVVSNGVTSMIEFLRDSAFPRLEKLDQEFDLIAFVWTPTAITEKSSSPLDDDLKLKCVSPYVAEINSELEKRCEYLLKDSRNFLGDNIIKDFISSNLTENLSIFLEQVKSTSTGLFLGRWCATVGELCPTLWKLLKQNDATKLRQLLTSISEHCCSAWSAKILDNFQNDLKHKIGEELDTSILTQTMPVAEEYMSEGEGSLKPSIRVPLQVSHVLQSLLFTICLEFGRIGPQSIPKSVRDNFRLAVGQKLAESYDKLNLTKLTSQAAIQLIFDLKYVQWFHPKLSNIIEPSLTKLQGIIDPFDLDIVNAKLKINLKRCIFENHLTLGLLFSEESHGFVAQSFKTRGNQNFPLANPAQTVPLPLLPI